MMTAHKKGEFLLAGTGTLPNLAVRIYLTVNPETHSRTTSIGWPVTATLDFDDPATACK